MYTSGQLEDIPKTTFVWNEDTEAERIFYTSATAACGFFYEKNFIVLPHLTRGSASCVHLPHLDFTRIHDYWNIVKNTDDSAYISVPETVRVAIKTLLPKSETQNINILRNREDNWKAVEKVFWKYVQNLRLNDSLHIKHLEVRVTSYGTISSYLRPKNKKDILICYLRKDMSVAHLAEIILTALFRQIQRKLKLPWETTEGMVDILLTHSPLAKYFHSYKPTLYATNSTTEHMHIQSSSYLRLLGLSYEKPFSIIKNTVYYLKKPIEHILTHSQIKIMKFLIQNENIVVEYDILGNILWKSEEDYSLWAITKQLQRLVANLKSYGVPESMFHIVRGKGFMFTNG